MNKFRGDWKEHFWDIFKHPLWNLSITFDWRIEIWNVFLVMKSNLILLFLFSSNYFEKVIILCLYEVWNFTLNIFPLFWQWAVKLLSSNYPLFFENLWWKMDFNIKMTSLPSILANISEAFPLFYHQNLLDELQLHQVN